MQAAGAVFGVLLAGSLVVALAQSRANSLHPLDLLLLTNFVTANGSFRQSESFSPVCLPRFNSSGFLHAYINYIHQVEPHSQDGCILSPCHLEACLMLISELAAADISVASPEISSCRKMAMGSACHQQQILPGGFVMCGADGHTYAP